MGVWSSNLNLLDPAYAKIVLDAVAAKDFDHTWAPLQVSGAGHSLELLVSSDALKIDGVRVNVSATLQQTIADSLGALLPTPKIMDLIWLGRTATFAPAILPIAATTDAMVKASAQLDARIAAALPALVDLSHQVLGGAVLLPSQKTWAIGNSLLQHAGRAMNYGFFVIPTSGTTYSGITTEACVSITNPKLGRVIQGQGWAHDISHSDYSQTCWLVHRRCKVDGVEKDLATDVLQDKTLAPIVSHEGALQVLRQPGVAESCPFPVKVAMRAMTLDSLTTPAATPSGLCATPPWPGDVGSTHPWLRAGAYVAGAAGLAYGARWAYRHWVA